MKRKLIVVLVLLILAGTGTWSLYIRADRSRQGERKLYGNVDIREVSLGFRVSGKIAKIMHEEGDAVKSGDVLAMLDDEPYRRELLQAEAQVAAAQARLNLIRSGFREEEIAQARAITQEREVTLQNAERQFQRADQLLGTRAMAQQDRDDAEARFREAEARLISARQQLTLLQAGFRKEEVDQAEAELKRAQAAQEIARLRLDDTVLKAPSNGTILTRALEPGAIVQTGSTVLALSLREPVWVRAYVNEPELGKIAPGMKVLVYTDSAPSKPYSGQIGFISPRAEFTPKNVETADLRTSLVYRFRVTVTNADEGLRQGMPVTLALQ